MSYHLNPNKRVGVALRERTLGSLGITNDSLDGDWCDWKNHVPCFVLVLRRHPQIFQGDVVMRLDSFVEAYSLSNLQVGVARLDEKSDAPAQDDEDVTPTPTQIKDLGRVDDEHDSPLTLSRHIWQVDDKIAKLQLQLLPSLERELGVRGAIGCQPVSRMILDQRHQTPSNCECYSILGPSLVVVKRSRGHSQGHTTARRVGPEQRHHPCRRHRRFRGHWLCQQLRGLRHLGPQLRWHYPRHPLRNGRRHPFGPPRRRQGVGARRGRCLRPHPRCAAMCRRVVCARGTQQPALQCSRRGPV